MSPYLTTPLATMECHWSVFLTPPFSYGTLPHSSASWHGYQHSRHTTHCGVVPAVCSLHESTWMSQKGVVKTLHCTTE